jgi:hypothetical protein
VSVFDLIGELVFNIVAGLVELVIRLLAAVLRSSYLIQHTKGLARYGHGAAAVLGAYLLFGIGRAFYDGWETPALQPLYSMPLVVGAIVLLLVALAIPEAAREIAAPERKDARKEEPAMLWPLALVLSFALVVGAISLWSGEVHRRTLAERACDAANAQVSVELRATAEKGLALADRLLKREAATRLPCAD